MYTNKTILLTKEICQIIGIQDTIETMGFQPKTVENNGTDVIRKAALLRPCGIITQFLLTDQNAVNIIQKLRKAPVPILYLIVGTGEVPSVIEQIVKSQNTYYLCIPPDINDEGRAERVNRFIRDELDPFTLVHRMAALLLQLGVMPRRIGYTYIKDSAMMLLKQLESYRCCPEKPYLPMIDKTSAGSADTAYGDYKKVLH